MPGARCPSKTPATLLAKSLCVSRGGAAEGGEEEVNMLLVAPVFVCVSAVVVKYLCCGGVVSFDSDRT